MQFSAIFATVLAATVATVSAQTPAESVITLTPCPPGATPTPTGGHMSPPPFTGAANGLSFPTAAAAAVVAIGAMLA